MSSQSHPRLVGALIAEPAQAGILDAALKEKEWLLGQSLKVEYRITNGDTSLAEAYARELLALHPDVLFAVSNTSMAALHAARSKISTVFAMVSDPVGMRYVASFARPGGNVTGFGLFEPSRGGKWVALVKEVAPNVQHIGIVYNPEPGNNSAVFRTAIDAVANRVGISSIETPSGNSLSLDRLIRSFKGKPNSGLIFLPDAITYVRRNQITSLVAQCGLRAIYPFRAFCETGRAHVVRREDQSDHRKRSVLCRSDPARGHSCRTARSGSDRIRAGREPKSCAGIGPPIAARRARSR